ncbi:unnamed protein product [Amoebophrya sp. A25]|nr:unnamed protein product [Amoebophrya sp. A25]|eukprot:GSA25T00027386001.1
MRLALVVKGIDLGAPPQAFDSLATSDDSTNSVAPPKEATERFAVSMSRCNR